MTPAINASSLSRVRHETRPDFNRIGRKRCKRHECLYGNQSCVAFINLAGLTQNRPRLNSRNLRLLFLYPRDFREIPCAGVPSR